MNLESLVPVFKAFKAFNGLVTGRSAKARPVHKFLHKTSIIIIIIITKIITSI